MDRLAPEPWTDMRRNVGPASRRNPGPASPECAVWTKASATKAYKKFYETHDMTPHQYRYLYLNGDKSALPDVAKNAANICSAVVKYANGVAALNRELGIAVDKTRRWTRKAILDGYREVIERWGLSPNQLLNDHNTGKVQLDEKVALGLSRLIGVTKKHFSSSKEIFDLLGFKPPSRPRIRRHGNVSIQNNQSLR